MLKKIYGSAVFGVEAHTITIEVNVDYGIGYHLVGLPDNAIKESNFRIAAALQNNGYKIPGKKLIINMSPADMRKEGSAYDLPLAMGILAASNQIKEMHIERYIIMGELSLDGTVQSIKGALPIAIKALEEGFEGFILPKENAKEAAIVSGLKVYGVEHISEVIDRIDIHIEVTPVPFEKLSDERKGESSVNIRKRVTKARAVQTKRFEDSEVVHYNAQMNTKQIRKYCKLDASSMQLLKTAMERLNLSARAYDRILKVARTIADLEDKISIESSHISEAIQYRSLDREGWLG